MPGFIPSSLAQFGSSNYLTGNMVWKRKDGIIVGMVRACAFRIDFRIET
jgi:hypothetical protein